MHRPYLTDPIRILNGHFLQGGSVGFVVWFEYAGPLAGVTKKGPVLW